MSRLWISPEAAPVFYQTLERAAARHFLFEWSSQAEAEREITRTFFAAARITELGDGTPGLNLGEERTLDLAEARLAAATLNRAADGDRLIAADEARSAYERLEDTVGSMLPAPSAGRSYCDYLQWQTSARAEGWRRISDAAVAREIRGLFRGALIESVDPRPGLDLVDAVLAAFLLNFQVGGSDEDIGWNDVMFTSAEAPLRGLAAFSR